MGGEIAIEYRCETSGALRTIGPGIRRQNRWWCYAQQCFYLHTARLDARFIQKLRVMFGAQEVKITVEAVEQQARPSQREVFLKMEQHRKRLGRVKIDPSVDIAALGNEVNDTPL